jgi:erythromycin esterase-like protein
MDMTTTARLFLSLLMLAVFLSPEASVAQSGGGDAAALDETVHGVCKREIVMIGESATHGDGHTEAFKVALVERLVNECGFDSVLFEASHYEFINISRQLRMSRAVTADQVSSAIGGLWKFDEEFKPLVPFLLTKAIDGTISLGGLDDQLGQLGQDYSNVTLLANLAMVLPKPESQECNDALHRRVYSDGYTDADAPKVLTCLGDIRRYYATDGSKDHVSRNEWLEMIDAIQRWVKRDVLPTGDQIVGRDRSMYQDYLWLRQRQPKRHKAILWMATVHVAKMGDPTWGDRTGANFGSLMHQQYGVRAFSLGFSALEGDYRQGRETHKQPAAPADSLEAGTLRRTSADAIFVGPEKLSSLGTIPAAIFRHSYQTLPWIKYIDGAVIFRTEHAPTGNKRN